MKYYIVKPERNNLNLFGYCFPMTEDELNGLATKWNVPRDELLKQVEEFNPEIIDNAVDMIENVGFGIPESLMDDELRERIHDEMSPCEEVDFLAVYMYRHEKKFGKPFVIN